MCAPDHFRVAYKINPWMDPESWGSRGDVLPTASRREWGALHRALSGFGDEIDHVAPAHASPTSSSPQIVPWCSIVSRCWRVSATRSGGAKSDTSKRLFAPCRHAASLMRWESCPTILFLRAGDCVWDDVRGMFWMGFGRRADVAARDVIEDQFGVPAVALELVDPRFYHMDTALCPLTRGEVVYAPGAFTPLGQAIIRDRVEPALRIELRARGRMPVCRQHRLPRKHARDVRV
jgi:N-dimethylarginine dimethylaminohydrolase